MPHEITFRHNHYQGYSPTARDVVAVLFRQRRLATGLFAAIFVGVLVYGWLSPAYEAKMKVLVGHGRVDPVMTPQANATLLIGAQEVSEEEINSEVEMLRDEELLRNVVRVTGLAERDPFRNFRLGRNDEDARIERSVRRLAKRLSIEPLRKTNLIEVSYQSSDPVLAARVLNSVSNAYLEKHTQVHRPSGEFNFFEQQTIESRKRLENAEFHIVDFTRGQGVVSAALERDIALQKLGEADASYRQLRLAIAETGQRMRALDKQMASFPQRSVTQISSADNPQLLEKLKSKLLDLELKRTELLTKYEPSYRLVEEVDQQITEAKDAIAAEAGAPVRDETTEKNPNYEWAKAELEKAQVEYSALQARAGAQSTQLAESQKTAWKLEENSIAQQDLMRTAKAAEETYLIYVRKREEARIGDALDARGILNISIAQPPIVPALPTHSQWTFAMAGFVLAGALSSGAAFAADFLDPAFRTPDEVVAYLGDRLLASLPRGCA